MVSGGLVLLPLLRERNLTVIKEFIAPRVLLDCSPYATFAVDTPTKRGTWPCRWIACPGDLTPPFVTAYRRQFAVDKQVVVRIHVSADERYELFLDGVRIGRGNERGDEEHWYFETYDLMLTPGEHRLVARVWSVGPHRAYAQMTVLPGFLLSPDELDWVQRIGTGTAPWEVKRLGGYAFTDPSPAWGTGQNVVIDGSGFDWGCADGDGDGWVLAEAHEAGMNADSRSEEPARRLLHPATLPPMYDQPWTVSQVRHIAALPSSLAAPPETSAIPIRAADNNVDEQAAWQGLLDDVQPLTIPPYTGRRVLLDLTDYVCAYPELVVSGGQGSRVRVNWQEALYEQLPAQTKGDRNVIEGKYFTCAWGTYDGVGDTFLPDGGTSRRFETLWWQCGRYVEIVVQTADEALTLERLTLRETRYPLEMESRFDADDIRLTNITPLAVRALQMCAHETYMDCPF